MRAVPQRLAWIADDAVRRAEMIAAAKPDRRAMDLRGPRLDGRRGIQERPRARYQRPT